MSLVEALKKIKELEAKNKALLKENNKWKARYNDLQAVHRAKMCKLENEIRVKAQCHHYAEVNCENLRKEMSEMRSKLHDKELQTAPKKARKNSRKRKLQSETILPVQPVQQEPAIPAEPAVQPPKKRRKLNKKKIPVISLLSPTPSPPFVYTTDSRICHSHWLKFDPEIDADMEIINLDEE